VSTYAPPGSSNRPPIFAVLAPGLLLARQTLWLVASLCAAPARCGLVAWREVSLCSADRRNGNQIRCQVDWARAVARSFQFTCGGRLFPPLTGMPETLEACHQAVVCAGTRPRPLRPDGSSTSSDHQRPPLADRHARYKHFPSTPNPGPASHRRSGSVDGNRNGEIQSLIASATRWAMRRRGPHVAERYSDQLSCYTASPNTDRK
jgi:hypothetical protein